MLAAPADGADCRLRLLARVPLRDDGGYLSVMARIGGPASPAAQPVRLMIDTGSDAGLITPEAAAMLHLPPDRDLRVVLQGTGGAGSSVHVARLTSLAIGAMQLGDVPMPIGDLPGAPRLTPPVIGFLGGDVLSHFDLDIDVAAATLAFYSVRLPSLACAQPPAWSGAYTTIPLTPHGVRLSLTATLDGVAISALLDTGARSRLLSRDTALRLGVAAEALAGDPGGINSGVDMREQLYHWHLFRSLAIGGETASYPVLTVAPLAAGEPFDMLLGTDWLVGREVWISYATQQLFMRHQK